MTDVPSPDAEVRLELLRPSEIRAALAICPVVYLPLGTCEYHQEHLPVGLDGLTAHGLCQAAARAGGGLVYPALYHGTGGDHGLLPFTVMMPGRAEIEALLRQSMQRFEAFGVRLLVLFSGHFAPEQIAMIQSLAQAWNARPERTMQVLALAMDMAEGVSLPPDHAGLFETTLLAAWWPRRVDITALPPAVPGEDVDAGRSPYGRHRMAPDHPLWSIFGADPRGFDPAASAGLAAEMTAWLCGCVDTHLATSHGLPAAAPVAGGPVPCR